MTGRHVEPAISPSANCWSPTGARSRPRVIRTRAGAGHRHGRGLLRPGRGAAVRRATPTRPSGCPARPRPRPTCDVEALLAAAAGHRRRRGPPRLRVPVRERRASPGPAPRPGLTFVGPTPEAIEAMGSKIAAKELMAAAGVPVLPGAVFDDGSDPDPAELVKAADEIGFPVLVKAAFGGGGRGMRIVAEPAEAGRGGGRRPPRGRLRVRRRHGVPGALRRVARGTSRCRSSATTHGTVVHLFERECSIQRRYQKIIEEAPSPAVDAGAARPSCARPPSPRARPSATSARARSSSSSTPDGPVLLPRGQHPAAGRAPGHRADHRPGPGRAAARRSPAGQPLPPEVTGATLHRPRDRGPAVRRGRARRATCRPAGTCTRSTIPGRGRACGSTPALPSGIRGQHALRLDAGQGHRVRPDPRRRPPACWPARWPGPGCTAWSPTGTCWSGSCASRSSAPGPSTPAT